MRGFPILNLLIVVAFFGLAWWPLQRVIGSDRKVAGHAAVALPSSMVEEGSFALRVITSAPVKSLQVSNLGDTLVTVEPTGQELEFEFPLGMIENPPEGLEFWVEVEFVRMEGSTGRPAISLELAPDDMDQEPRTVTLWGEPGEAVIDAPALFLWENLEN